MHFARSKKFDKQYKKLEKKVQAQFGERLRLYLTEPSHELLHVHNLMGKYRGLKSFNVNADIRAIFEIMDGDTVYFSAIGTHSTLYE